MRLIRHAPFAIRVVERSGGRCAVVYRRKPNAKGLDRLQRIAGLSALGFTAGTPLLRDAVSKSVIEGRKASSGDKQLSPGAMHPLDADWGARVACFAFVAAGLRDGERLLKAAGHMRGADPNEAAWWLGMISRDDATRAVRALRILTEAVE